MALQADDMGFTQMVADQMSRNPNDTKGLVVGFHFQPVLDEEASKKEGRPIYADLEYITILTVGDKDNIVDRPVWDIDKQRFRDQYKDWSEKRVNTVKGTPLSAWPLMSKSQVKELEFFNVSTVEQLADLNDSNAQKFPGILNLRQKAKDFLIAAKDAGHLASMRSEMEAKDATISELTKSLEEMKTRLSALEKGARK